MGTHHSEGPASSHVRTTPDRPSKGAPVTAYKRVLLKLSGEVFGGGRVGVDPVVVEGIAREIADVVRSGVEVAVVVVHPDRLRALAMRMAGVDRRWVVTDLMTG